MKLKPVNQQVVVIYGASSGIGREAANLFAKQGAKVVVSARSNSGINSLISELKEDKRQCLGVISDATSGDSIKEVVTQALEAYGKIDTWVHCAGVTVFDKFETTSEEEFKRVIDINLMGVARAAWAVIPHLKKNGGSFIAVTSVEAIRALPNQSAYAASKRAVTGLLDSLRVELMRENANVNVVNVMPANIDTPLYDKCRTKMHGEGKKYTGIGPTYSPNVVAESIVYASTHFRRDLIVGTIGWVIEKAQWAMPGLLDFMLAKVGESLEKTDTHKDVDDNLYKPIEFKYDNVQGQWSSTSWTSSWYNRWTQLW